MKSETDKKRIVLASVLKPVDDVRMFEKIGKSLSEKYELHLIGYKSAEKPKSAAITFYPLFDFKSSGNKRAVASFLFHKTLKKIAPDLLIIHTIELLPIACWYKLFQNRNLKIIYDIQENYFRNFLYQNIYPFYVKIPLAFFVRSVEKWAKSLVNHYFLAEKNYKNEFSFSEGKHTILENKCVIYQNLKHKKLENREGLQLVFSGTISEVYGAYEAIDFAQKLNKSGFDVHLQFVGQVIEKKLLTKITFLVQQSPNQFSLLGGNEIVPHRKIITELLKADFVLLPYQPNKSTQNCIPSRLYECLAYKIPMIIQENELWKEICKPYGAACFLDFQNLNVQKLMQQIGRFNFYENIETIEEANWENEESKLLNTVSTMLK